MLHFEHMFLNVIYFNIFIERHSSIYFIFRSFHTRNLNRFVKIACPFFFFRSSHAALEISLELWNLLRRRMGLRKLSRNHKTSSLRIYREQWNHLREYSVPHLFFFTPCQVSCRWLTFSFWLIVNTCTLFKHVHRALWL